MEADRSPLSFLARRLPPPFERRVVVLAPGETWAYDPAGWRDALVVVEQGEVELEGLGGSRRRFGRGAFLALDGLSLRALHNRRQEAAVLVAISRRAAGAAC